VYILGGTMLAGSLIFGGSLKDARAAGETAPVLFGSVVEVNGQTITVAGKSGKAAAPTTYTLDASNAQITEGLGLGSQELSPQNIAVGDAVAVIGAHRA